jgi:hypothetical protein
MRIEDLKEDVLRELRSRDGKLLLHDELETEAGSFEIVPQWEKVTEADILTPQDVFELVAKEGFKVGCFPRFRLNKFMIPGRSITQGFP